jgi:hypothetical protein
MRTRATRISNAIVFKHQYITSPTISPESHMVAAAQQLITALQGNIPAGNEPAEALTKVSELFTKIALAKKEVAKAKEQRNRLRANSLAWITTHLPRVAVPPPRVDVVGRRGTNQLRLLERYLDVLVKHTTEIPPPTALVEVRPQLP